MSLRTETLLLIMKKYLLLFWNKLSFLCLTYLTALVVTVLGISILDRIKKLPEFSIQSTSPNADTSFTPLPSNTEENLLLLSPVPPQKQFNSEEEHQQFPQPLKSPAKVETYLGHFPYSENKQQNLVKVADFYGREEFLDKTAANAFNRMKSDAKTSGVELTIISGFRPIAQQEKFFLKQINKRGSKEAAARFSAPPGYSEHHTGYALDIGEGENIDTYIKSEFEYSEAYRWLVKNAHKYGFELSFPKNNPQGVSYEPWHWRFVGSQKAQDIFRMARTSLNNNTTSLRSSDGSKN